MCESPSPPPRFAPCHVQACRRRRHCAARRRPAFHGRGPRRARARECVCACVRAANVRACKFVSACKFARVCARVRAMRHRARVCACQCVSVRLCACARKCQGASGCAGGALPAAEAARLLMYGPKKLQKRLQLVCVTNKLCDRWGTSCRGSGAPVNVRTQEAVEALAAGLRDKPAV